jgi:hypothetical protein
MDYLHYMKEEQETNNQVNESNHIVNSAVLSGLSDIRQDISSLGDRMRDQNIDLKRLLESVKQTLELIREKEKQNDRL